MNRRSVRDACLMATMAVSAAIAAPPMSRQPLSVATAELAAAPSMLATAVAAATPSSQESHLGFDTNAYPGDKAMDAWKRSGEYEWVGYYLEAPCHSDASWSGKRARLVRSGWGLAVIYVGQQTWGKPVGGAVKQVAKVSKKSKGRKTYQMTRKSTAPVAKTGDGCFASYVGAAQGRIDARSAIAAASREGFERGTVVFLDVEHMNTVPQAMRDYYTAWAQTLLADGRYRPGIYAHTANAAMIYDDVNAVYRKAGINSDPPFWIAGTRGFSVDRVPTDVGHAFASVWQGVLDVVRTHNGVKLPVDISVASAASPSDAAAE
jgi:Rv2525c-like, glycoside hydrolase-like domain